MKFFSSTALNTGVSLAGGGGSWSNLSDRNAKRGFEKVDGADLLARLDQIPMSKWSYKSQEPSIRHMGPMAQDLYAAFGLGEDDTHIDDIDGQGVALAGVQALYRLSLEKDAQIRTLKAEVERLKKVETEMTALEARLARLEGRTQATRAARTTPKIKKPAGTEVARVGI